MLYYYIILLFWSRFECVVRQCIILLFALAELYILLMLFIATARLFLYAIVTAAAAAAAGHNRKTSVRKYYSILLLLPLLCNEIGQIKTQKQKKKKKLIKKISRGKGGVGARTDYALGGWVAAISEGVIDS